MCVVKDYTDFKGKGYDPNYFYPVMSLCSKGNNEMVLIVKDLKKIKISVSTKTVLEIRIEIKMSHLRNLWLIMRCSKCGINLDMVTVRIDIFEERQLLNKVVTKVSVLSFTVNPPLHLFIKVFLPSSLPQCPAPPPSLPPPLFLSF